MHTSLRNPAKISIQDHPNYRVVQVSESQGQVGMLLPHANLVVPDKRTIRDLKQIIQFYETLKLSKSFSYDTANAYRKSGKPTELNMLNDLPLFKNPSIA